MAAFGLYTAAGLLLVAALFAEGRYPRPLAWLGAAEWGVSVPATVLAALGGGAAAVVVTIAIVLYGPWLWASAWWLLRDPA